MINRKYTRSKQKIKIHKKFSGFLIVLLVFFVFINFSLKTTIEKAINYQAKIIATNILNQKILEVLSNENAKYNDFVSIKRDNNNNVTSVEANMSEINKIKTTLTKNVTEALNQIKIHNYSIPLGTLIGSDYLTGRGPNINMRITPMGFLDTQLISQFKSIGINQTNHEIVIKLSLELTTIVPLHKSTTKVETNFLVAETVIVGKVPEYYTNIISSDRSAIGDYKGSTNIKYPDLSQ